MPDAVPSPLRDQIAHATRLRLIDETCASIGANDESFARGAAAVGVAAGVDAALELVAARDAERQAAITALRRPPAFDRDASSVRHGYNAALADVLAILRGTTDA